MNIKDMKRSDWKRITKRDYISRECTVNGHPARESLILIREIAAPLTVSGTGKAVKVVEKDYSWLQVAQEGAPWWLTAMFDERGALLQIYFDITAGNRFDDPENPTFRDMYLDVVVHDDGELFVLDLDELDEALEKDEITRDEYNQARAACDELHEYLSRHTEEVMNQCRRVYRELKAQISV